MSKSQLTKIDHSAITVNQGVIIFLSVTAFILDSAWLIGIVAIFMIAGTIFKIPGFGFIYHSVLKPLKLMKTDLLLDNPEPHRFAQGIGAFFLAVAGLILLLMTNSPITSIIGWGLVWMVIVLAALNLFTGLCVGCVVYYWFNRLQMLGFDKSPPDGAKPGVRPKTKVS